MFREFVGIGRGLEDFHRHQARRLVISVSIARRAVETRNQHVWPVGADHADTVAQNVLFAPVLQGLIHAFGETEIGHAGEELVHAVVTASR